MNIFFWEIGNDDQFKDGTNHIVSDLLTFFLTDYPKGSGIEGMPRKI